MWAGWHSIWSEPFIKTSELASWMTDKKDELNEQAYWLAQWGYKTMYLKHPGYLCTLEGIIIKYLVWFKKNQGSVGYSLFHLLEILFCLLFKQGAKAFLQQSTGPSLTLSPPCSSGWPQTHHIAKDNLELRSKVNSIFQELGLRVWATTSYLLGPGDQTQGFVCVRQSLCQLSYVLALNHPGFKSTRNFYSSTL